MARRSSEALRIEPDLDPDEQASVEAEPVTVEPVRKTELRVVPPPKERAVPKKAKLPPLEVKPGKLNVREIDLTLKELEAQRATLVSRMPEAAMKKGETKIITEQIAAVNREIAELKAKRGEIIGRIQSDFGTRGEPKEKVLERMGRSFEIAREKKQVEEAHEEAKLDRMDQERQKALRHLDAKYEGVAETEAEAEFFSAGDEEAARRAEGMETLAGEGLSAEEAAREWSAMVEQSAKGDAEARQRTIAFVDNLRRRFPDYISFSGADYAAALQKPAPKVGFFKKIFGGRTEVQKMEDAMDSVPNIGELYASFMAARGKRDKATRFRGVRGR